MKRMVVLAVGMALAGFIPLSHAQQPAPDPYARIISALSFDLNGDGWIDRILLVENVDGDADVVILTGAQGTDGVVFRRALHRKAIAFSGQATGQGATLSTNRGGSVVVSSQNETIGRLRWNRTVTIAFRNGAFVVAGFSHNERDTLTGKGGACDINHLSGRMTRNGQAFPGKVEPVRVEAFDPDQMPAACQF